MAEQPNDDWHDLGDEATVCAKPLQQIAVGKTKLAVSCVGGVIGAVSGVCNHAGGPLGDGVLDGDYVVCPWHAYKFHRVTGQVLGVAGADHLHLAQHLADDDFKVLVMNVLTL